MNRERWPLDYYRQWHKARTKEEKDRIALSVPEKFRAMFKDYVETEKAIRRA